MQPSRSQSWRVAKWSRIGAVALAVTSALFFGSVGVISDFPLLVIASVLLPSLLTWRCAIHPKIEIDGQTLRLTNPFATHVFQLKDIVGVESSYSGIEIRLGNGKKKTAWAAQRTNVAHYLDRPTRSDQIVREIRAAASKAGGDIDRG